MDSVITGLTFLQLLNYLDAYRGGSQWAFEDSDCWHDYSVLQEATDEIRHLLKCTFKWQPAPPKEEKWLKVDAGELLEAYKAGKTFKFGVNSEQRYRQRERHNKDIHKSPTKTIRDGIWQDNSCEFVATDFFDGGEVLAEDE